MAWPPGSRSCQSPLSKDRWCERGASRRRRGHQRWCAPAWPSGKPELAPAVCLAGSSLAPRSVRGTLSGSSGVPGNPESRPGAGRPGAQGDGGGARRRKLGGCPGGQEPSSESPPTGSSNMCTDVSESPLVSANTTCFLGPWGLGGRARQEREGRRARSWAWPDRGSCCGDRLWPRQRCMGRGTGDRPAALGPSTRGQGHSEDGAEGPGILHGSPACPSSVPHRCASPPLGSPARKCLMKLGKRKHRQAGPWAGRHGGARRFPKAGALTPRLRAAAAPKVWEHPPQREVFMRSGPPAGQPLRDTGPWEAANQKGLSRPNRLGKRKDVTRV